MTHAGQLAMLRRLHGVPVPSENFIFANVSAANVSSAQALPAAPDLDWRPKTRRIRRARAADGSTCLAPPFSTCRCPKPLMHRALASAIVLVAAFGCSSGQNTECRWPEEVPRQLDLRSEADAAHLMADVELAEELSVRFADNSGTGPGPLRQRLRLEKCFEPLTAGIIARHGVSMADVLGAQARIGDRGSESRRQRPGHCVLRRRDDGGLA